MLPVRFLLRRDESYVSIIRTNYLVDVSDTDRYSNPRTDAGFEEPLLFQCAVHEEPTVDGWNKRATN